MKYWDQFDLAQGMVTEEVITSVGVMVKKVSMLEVRTIQCETDDLILSQESSR